MRTLNLEETLLYYEPEYRPIIEQAFQHALETGETWDLEARLINKNGKLQWVRTMGKPFIAHGKVVRITGNVLDITERKQSEAEREKLQAQLLQAQKIESVGRLAGGVAHDFNNMLGVIIGHAELAMDRLQMEDKVFADLKEILNAGFRSAELTRQLLAFARKQTIAPKVLKLNAIVKGMIKMLQRLIGEDVDLKWMPGEDLWLVEMDPGQIDQILVNLCINARDAISGVGKIIIETRNITFDENDSAIMQEAKAGDYVLISVSDDGGGIAPDMIDHIFEPFFTTKGMGEGTGLGLSTVYGIVKQNKGINFIQKPFSKLELAGKVRLILDS